MENILRDLSNERLETERLILLPVSLEYAPQMLAELTDEVTKYMSFYSPKSIEEEFNFVNQFREKMRRGTDLALVILDKHTKEYLGGVGIHHLDTKSPELGVWVKKSAHGRKIGREAVAGVYKWAENNAHFDHFVYPAHKDNIPSRKIGSPGIPVVTGRNSLSRRAKALEILGMTSKDNLFSREFRESLICMTPPNPLTNGIAGHYIE
jgi:[ribosomal protein S5]-alanine N-acetyltransferase